MKSKVYEQLRRLLSGALMAGVSGVQPAPASAQPVPETGLTTAPPTTMVERVKKTAKLVLRLPVASGFAALAHRSHASHASHSSHASHYSGTGGGGTVVTPTPAPRPSTAAPATATERAPAASLASLDDITAVSGTITVIDLKARTFSVRETSTGAVKQFSYRDDTTISLENKEARLDEYMDLHGSDFPFAVNAKVEVKWKVGADLSKKVATGLRPGR
jgi:hypothetical protein